MATVRRLARDITGRQVTVVDFPDYYFIGPDHLEIPGGKGKKEQAIHEVCHWVVAEDWQRGLEDNLGYGHSQDGYAHKDKRCNARMMEQQELMACHVQRMLYQLAGTPFPSGLSCNHKDRKKGLTDDEVAWVLARSSEAGWLSLVEMARSRF